MKKLFLSVCMLCLFAVLSNAQTPEAPSGVIVDGGSLQNANLQLIPGCEVIVRNGGTINMANGKEFNAPIKAIVTVSQGGIR